MRPVTRTSALGGKGSSITIKTTQVRAPYGSFLVAFEGASGGTATLKIRDETGTCTQGQAFTLAQLSITFASVKDGEVKFTVTAA